MKVLYIELSLRGHCEKYLKSLAEADSESVALLPDPANHIACRQIEMKSGYNKKRNLLRYLKWIKEIQRTVEAENIEIVHFLCGDALYRFFGIGLSNIKAPILITYHHMRFDPFRNIALKHIFRKSYGIVHTKYLKEQLNNLRIKNVEKIEYPVFVEEGILTQSEAKKLIGLKEDIPCLLTLGGTQKYKGVDILLQALQKVSAPFQLYMTGVIRDISFETIQEISAPYAENVVFNMNRLSDVDYQNALSAADILVLPYRREFDGASGPMIEAVWSRKYIVGSSHGSMGQIIREKELGTTFEAENTNDLAAVLNRVLMSPREWSMKAEQFREEVTVERFLARNKDLYARVMKI